MATVTSWTESLPEGIGSVYPYVGTEWLWLTIAVIFWIVWHVKTAAGETEEHDALASKGKGASDYKSNITEW